MPWSITLAIVAHTRTKAWKDDIPLWQRMPMKSRGDVAYLIDSPPDGSPPEGTVSPYLFLTVTGIPDTVTRERLETRFRERVDTPVLGVGDDNARQVIARHNASIDLSLLPTATQNDLAKTGIATCTTTELIAAATNRAAGRKFRLTDL